MINRRIIYTISMVLILATVLIGCTPASNDDALTSLESENTSMEEVITSQDDVIASLNQEVEDLSAEIEALQNASNESPAAPAASNPLVNTALDVVAALQIKDMAALTALSHPTTPIRFTPYSYVDTTSDLTFPASQFATLISDPTVYTWGAFDGSGDPINYTFDDYLDNFVYDEDYLNPHIIGVNTFIGTGNSINNLQTIYPSASFVEFHFNGFDPQYGGMDWSSLILVFENVAGNWKLIGIVHGQWTI